MLDQVPTASGNGHSDTGADDVKEALEKRHVTVTEGDDIDNLFRIPEHNDTTRLLISPDADIAKLFMRSTIPNNRIIMAVAGLARKCIEHDYPEGLRFIELLLAGLPARQGARANMVADVIIGEKHSAHRAGGEGAFNKFKRWIGGGDE